MTEAVIESWLVRLARETAAHIDLTLSGLRTAVLLWAEEETLAAHARKGPRGRRRVRRPVARLTGRLGRRAARLGDVALAMIVGPGRPDPRRREPDGSKSAASLNGRFDLRDRARSRRGRMDRGAR